MANNTPRNRYPGVQPFRTDQVGIFFGRNEDTQRLFSTVSGERLTVLYGKSGYGKSSLIQAGLLPRMAEENERGRRRYLPLVIRFNAWQEGATLFAKYNFQQTKALREQDIEQRKSGSLPESLPQTLWGNWKRQDLPDNAHLVLIFDQFEEFFTYPTDQQAAFKEQLAELLYTDYPRYLEENEDTLDADTLDYLSRRIDVRALFSIRSDRLSELDRLQDRLPAILHKRLQLGPLTPAQARAAIVQPALLPPTDPDTGAVVFDSPAFEYRPETLARLEETLQNSQPGAGGGVEAFLLQVFCNAIEVRVAAGQIPDRDANGLPDVEVSDLPATDQVLEEYYARQIGSVAPHLQPVARRIIEDQLIQVEGDGTGRRMSVDGRALLQTYGGEGVDQVLLDKLVEHYLLRREPNSTGGLSYELSHDTLLVPALASRKVREEAVAAAKFERDKLAAEAKLREQEVELAAERRKRRRERLFGLLMAVLAVGAFGASVWAFRQQRAAKAAQQTAESQRVVADSLLIVANDNIAEAKRQTDIANRRTGEAVVAQKDAETQRVIAERQTRMANVARSESEERAARAAALNEALAKGENAYQYLLDRGNHFFGVGYWRDAVTYWGAARFLATESSEEERLADGYLGLAQTASDAVELILEGEILGALTGFSGIATARDSFLDFTMAETRIAQLESTLAIWEREVGGRNLEEIDSIYLGPVENENQAFDYPIGIIGIPKEIRELKNLTTLKVIRNKNLSALPKWQNLDQLRSIEINSNHDLISLPSWNGLEKLQRLEIISNGGLKVLPPWQGLEQIQHLLVSYNYNLNDLPAWKGLENLQHLNISFNSGLSTLPEWSGLDNLQTLVISNNSGLLILPEWIGLKNLQQLRIVWNNKLSTLPEWHGLEKLRHLVISYNSSLKILPSWYGLDNLRQLKINYNSLLSTLPEWHGLENLQQLKLDKNDSLSTLPEWKGLEQLQQLEIINHKGLKELRAWLGLRQLKDLKISYNDGLYSLPLWLGLDNLEQLEISSNDGLSQIPEWRGLEQLQQLAVNYNQALKSLPEWQGLEKLQHLVISGNRSLQVLPNWQEKVTLKKLEITVTRIRSSLTKMPWSVEIDTLFLVNNFILDSLPSTNVASNKIEVMQYASNGNSNQKTIMNSWLGFAEIKEIYFTHPISLNTPPKDTSPNIHTLPKTFINLAPTLKILDLRGTSIPPEEVAYWRRVLPDTDIRYEME